ncbi:MAG TPA: hypothetical protein DEQ43_26480 [Nocardioides bacterium]|nr:hypothetical protein [Nocardioides sp.]
MDDQQVAGARGLHLELELTVRLLEHQLVLGGGRAEPVPPYLVLAPQLVVDEVEEVRRVRGPRAARGRAGHDVGQLGAGAEMAKAQLIDLVAVEVDRVGEQLGVGGNRPHPEVHIALVGRHLVDIQQHFVGSARNTTT